MRDRNGDPVSPEDVLAPDELGAYYRANGWPRYTGYEGLALGADPDVIWRQEHENCGPDYECIGCGKRICYRCEPSPTEADELCGSCYWIADDGPDGAA
jgi:hypothetical protein